MLKLFVKMIATGVITEEPPDEATSAALGAELKRGLNRYFRGSIAIRHVDAGSCNACELEIHALSNPFYNVERYGVHFVASPRHADVLLVTGPVSRHMEAALRRTWEAMPHPKWVIASGDCACDGGEFGASYASCGAVDNIIPVDLRIPGCPPAPTDLLSGLLQLMQTPYVEE
ncbi:NADH-quinone oxidoreductase subunit B family protein [Haliea sp. E1-2-M8]|uniref:NADH-quinone oxidoreductase subunit B family protein n=1 Tax=Haliea sp. E1-2-M8 TaxID=3064706 RepID=UPI002721142D|nr:NADH-quinone oxidoreductase subunit B family protein [Haliea sp. E1-2-M8]MDO8864082.1 NADH-quinone oxidoreductase subunit B family protein [Haliea sp. E1-2-M8]